jgi:hypothetical protein
MNRSGNMENQGDKNERTFGAGDCGRSVVFPPGVATAPVGNLDLNAAKLLGREQKEGW